MHSVERKDEVAAQAALEKALEEMRPSRFALTLDRILEPVSPRLVSKRIQARQELGYRRAMFAYAAAQYPSATYQRQGVAGSLTSEEAEFPGWTRFQAILEARDLYRNMPIIRALVNGMARRSVATGIHPVFATGDRSWNRKAKEAWSRFEENCELRGVMDMTGIDRQVIRSCFVDGDLGVVFVEDEDDGLKLQLVEGDLIAENNRTGINIDTVNPIGGVWLDENGRPTHYQVGRRGIGGLLVDSEKVPAEEMLLLFRQQRVDQVRGAPLLAPVIQIARDLDRYLTATRLQANIAATYGVVIKRDMPAQFILQQTKAAESGDYRTMPLKTGQMTILNPGESIEQFRPDVPSNQFDTFAKFLVRLIAIGAGSSYEYVMQDFSGMSFSSSRTTMLDCTLTMQEWQRFLVARFKRKTMVRWLASEMNREALPFNDEAFTSVHWQGPAELGVDPERDANANIQLLAAGLKGYDTLYSEQGRDWKERLRAKADQVKFIQDLATERGVSPELISTAIPPGTLRPGDPGEPPTLARVPGSEGKAQPITD